MQMQMFLLSWHGVGFALSETDSYFKGPINTKTTNST